MRVEAADVASALDKLSYEKVSLQGWKGQQKFSSFLYFYDSTYLFAIGILCMIEDGQNFVTLWLFSQYSKIFSVRYCILEIDWRGVTSSKFTDGKKVIKKHITQNKVFIRSQYIMKLDMCT